MMPAEGSVVAGAEVADVTVSVCVGCASCAYATPVKARAETIMRPIIIPSVRRLARRCVYGRCKFVEFWRQCAAYCDEAALACDARQRLRPRPLGDLI